MLIVCIVPCCREFLLNFYESNMLDATASILILLISEPTDIMVIV